MTDVPPITESLAFTLHRATVLVDRVADTFLRTHFDLSYSLFSVLLIAGTMHGPHQSRIAEALAVSRASITQRVAALGERGLVRTVPDAHDGRATQVVLTPAGGALLADAWAAMESHENGIDRGVDVATLTRELHRLIANATTDLSGSHDEEKR